MPPDAPDAWSDVIQLVDISRTSSVADFAPPPPEKRRRGPVLSFALLVLVPTILALVYFGLVAEDRYLSEARFVVRKPHALATPGPQTLSVEEGPKGLGTDDSYAVRDFILSRDGLRLAIDRANFRGALDRAQIDPIWTFPGFLNGRTDEDLYRLYQSLVSVDYESSTGLTTMRVQAFKPEDSQRIASALINGAEALINGLDERARRDAIAIAEAEVQRSRGLALKAIDQLSAFRIRESVIDPTQLSKTVLNTIAALSLQLVEAAAQMDMTLQSSPRSPQLAPLKSRIKALQAQIESERRTMAGGDRSFVPRIAEYERLSLEREFAQRSLLSSLTLLEAARLDAERQQVYLDRLVQPGVADKALYPRSVLWTLGIFLSGLSSFWLFRPSR